MSEQLEQMEQKNTVVLGNTISKTTKEKERINPNNRWCGTLNNYTLENLEHLEQYFNSLCKRWVIGKEKGESGTPHLQIAIVCNKRVRPTETFKIKGIHWEKMISTEDKAMLYCMKDGDYTGVMLPKVAKPIRYIIPNRPYQQFILNVIKQEPDERKVYWFYETMGGVGKSSFCKYLCGHHDAIYIDEGKKADIINVIYNRYIAKKDIELVVFDIPRCNGNSVSYKAIETVKNGVINNTKYETGNAIFNSPHMVVFSNEPPDRSKLSNDRWEIYKILDNFEIVKE